jgi:hypothetical protein
VNGRGGRRLKQLLNDIKERENTRNVRRNTSSHCVGKFLWKRRKDSSKRDYEVNE